MDRRVLAIDATTGKLIWNNSFGSNFLDRVKITATYPWISAPNAHVHAMSYYRDKGWIIQSALACHSYAIDAKTGKTAWSMTPEVICGTNQEWGDPRKGIDGTLGRGFMSAQAHPPVFLGNIMFYPIGGGSGSGGRAFVTAFDMTDPQNPKRLYREFMMPSPQGDPNWAIDQCNKVNGNGWYFEYPKFLESINYPARDREPTYLATKCTDVSPDVVRNDWIDLVPGSKSFGKLHSASAVAPVWGHYPMDPETGIVYLGWGDQGPYPNLTHRYGPGLHGSGFTAHDIRTGKLVWWFNAIPHDMWDYDCAWNGILTKTSAGQKIYMKGCKNGILYGLDATTGKPIWIYDSPTILRNTGTNYGADKNNDPKGKDACCRLTKEDMSKQWFNAPSKEWAVNTCWPSCFESDMAFDGKRVYIAPFNEPAELRVLNVVDFGNPWIRNRQWLNPDWQKWLSTSIDAVDINTGKAVWSFKMDGVGYRGGLTVSGGMVFIYASDGNLKFLDAETGKLLHQKVFGIPVNVQPTIGATKDGKMLVLVHVGGGQTIYFPNNLGVDGVLVAYGLPEKLPQPQEVVKEAIKQISKEQLKEVIKDIPKEVIQEAVGPSDIRPISYAIIGIGAVFLVVAAVLFTRRKKV